MTQAKHVDRSPDGAGGLPMRFDAYRPRRLSGFVEQVWEQRSVGSQRWRILPSGWCELIFRLGPGFSLLDARALQPNEPTIQQFLFLSGLHTRPLDLSFSDFHVFGIRLHPVAVRALFGIPCSEVRDTALDGQIVLRDLEWVEHHLRSAPDFMARALWIEEELARRLAKRDDIGEAERMGRLFTALPLSSRTPVQELNRMLGYSRSHGYRLFEEWLGQSPTEAIRLARFVRAMHGIHEGRAPLAEIGYRVGYFDQSHFIREFREFSGMTPGAYQQRKGQAPEQISLMGHPYNP